jgi:hypothetical protein
MRIGYMSVKTAKKYWMSHQEKRKGRFSDRTQLFLNFFSYLLVSKLPNTMKKFLKELFSDDNSINEKSVVGFIAFLMMVFTLIVDIITGSLGNEMPIQEFVFDGFVTIVIGAFGIASIDKWVNKSKEYRNEKTDKN